MNYYLITIPFFIAIITQVIKLSIAIIKGKKAINELWSYGGMPSSHAALTSSLTTLVYLINGLDLNFLIALILTFIVIRDAAGLRQEISKHSQILNTLNTEKKSITLNERIGHTPFQLTIGAIIGIILTILLYNLFI